MIPLELIKGKLFAYLIRMKEHAFFAIEEKVEQIEYLRSQSQRDSQPGDGDNGKAGW